MGAGESTVIEKWQRGRWHIRYTVWCVLSALGIWRAKCAQNLGDESAEVSDPKVGAVLGTKDRVGVETMSSSA